MPASSHRQEFAPTAQRHWRIDAVALGNRQFAQLLAAHFHPASFPGTQSALQTLRLGIVRLKFQQAIDFGQQPVGLFSIEVLPYFARQNERFRLAIAQFAPIAAASGR